MRSRRTKKCPAVSAEDADLFRSSIGPVKPLRYDRVPAVREPPAPVARFRWQDDRRVMQDLLAEPGDAADLETGEELIFARPGRSQSFCAAARCNIAIACASSMARATARGSGFPY
jgi:hypothetical protein